MKLTKYLVYLTFSALTFTACKLQPKKNVDNTAAVAIATDTAQYSKIEWIDTVKNIGTLVKGEKASIKFRFKNVGTKPLFIISAQPGCGCTIADYPRNAIAVGEEAAITAGFDTEHQYEGPFKKSILVTTNTIGKQTYDLIFAGEIKAKD